LDLGGPEGHRRELVRLEEVGALEVAVTVGAAGVDAVHHDVDGGGGLRRVGAVQVQRAGELLEAALDVGDHGVPGDEADRGVRRVDGVVAGEGGQVRSGGGGGGRGGGGGVVLAVEDTHGVSPSGTG